MSTMKTYFYLPAIFFLLTACTFDEELNELSERHEREEQIMFYSSETTGSRDATCPIPQSAFAEVQFEISNETGTIELPTPQKKSSSPKRKSPSL